MKTFVIPSIKMAVAPTANENLSSGYPIGQHWFDTATGKEYYHSSDGVWEHFATTHKALPDKNSEAAVQHIDTTITKPTLDAADMVAIKDSVTGKIVLTPKINLQTSVVQSTGTSETDVMSQKSVTAELALKEVKTNKQNSLIADGTGTKFPTVDAVNAGLGAKANKVQEAWITPTLLNGWQTYEDNPFMYRKDTMGRVWFKGRLNPATKTNVSFMSLPVGYRPSHITYFNFGSSAYIVFAPSGACQNYFTSWVSLEGISFSIT